MRYFSFLRRLTVLTVVSTMIHGCATMTLPDYPASRESAKAKIGETNGVTVSAEPFFDKGRSEQYFGIDAASEGIAIFHVQVENQNPNVTFLLMKENIKFQPGATTKDSQTTPQRIERDASAGYTVLVAGLVLTPLMFAGGKMISDSTVVQHNFAAKELRNQTLSPGQRAQGFVYFQASKGQPFHGGILTVSLTDTATQQISQVEIQISK